VIPNLGMKKYNKSQCIVPTPKIVIESSTKPALCSSTSAENQNSTVACSNDNSMFCSRSGSDKNVKKIKISVSESSKCLGNSSNVSIQSILRSNGSANVDLGNVNKQNDDTQSLDSNEVSKMKTSASFSLEPKSLLGASKSVKPFYGSTISVTYSADSEMGKEIDTDEESVKKRNKKSKLQQPTHQVSGKHTPSDSERHRRKIAKARERRATLILGLIMGAFIIAWLPFFVMYSINGVCTKCVFKGAFTFAYWLGYCNSAINPIIYTVFNREYRKAFRKILFR